MLIAARATHANRTLRQQRDLDGSTRHDFEQEVKRAFEQKVDGSESEADVQVRVDDLLSQHLAPIHSKRRAQARQQLIDHAVAYAKQEVASEEED